MPMRCRLLKALSSCSLAIVMGGLSCSRPFWRFEKPKNQTESVAEKPAPQPAQADAGSDLRMFGRQGRARDIAFAGSAVTNLKQHTTPSDGADFDPDIDPTGKLIVYASTRNSPNSHLYVKSINGATITQITDGAGNDTQPKFDPTGARIAFSSDRGGHWDVWAVDANGRNPIQITNNAMPELCPSWAPDGKRLVYCRVNPKANRSELWVVGMDNPGVKRLIGEGLFPAWSPKGNKIAYQRARNVGSQWFSIWTIEIYDQEVLFPTEVAASPSAALISPAWSPDATQIAFTIIDPQKMHGGGASAAHAGLQQADIAIVDADGRGLHRLTDGDGAHYSPTWSSDGRIYFSTRNQTSETLWSVKPFRPAMLGEPPSAQTANQRRAVKATDEDMEN